ncbi:LacI family transcriptional regulator [Vibrio sp. SS-MA-C1-2]|uniref:LacI family DNA-binding transcriptional regulator n=1 Tax=Vibrio sp. SS-MA-C1-2 TaxID=2908646 RepID=UPI001F34A40C|nr:LacI family DNA-binding transcriptional regulator [Vibrio sp. SS-MA-C1-2]UJF18401.1 LacI family transcriptional regulator [Vibrio sp. SS-MA-C1-2]
MTTIADVSRHAGVSAATVSRVINNTATVSHQKKRRVEQAMKELGYRPNLIAQALASNRSGCIGLIVPSLGGPFYSQILHTVEEQLRKYGYHVIVTAGSHTEEGQCESIEYLIGRRVDALILHTQFIDDDYLIDIEEQGVPLVAINRFIPELSGSCISIDNEEGAFMATEHLLQMHHQEIACITGPLKHSDARERLQGYRKALESFGHGYSESLVVEGGFTEESGKVAMRKLLKRKESFSAIFVNNDHMAAGVYEELEEQGLKIPDDISIVGFDNITIAKYLSPQLSTINFPIRDMSEQAVELVIEKLHKKRREVRKKLLPSLVIRASVKERLFEMTSNY